MTSNLASEEIANYAQDLRREEEKKPPLVNSNVPTGWNLFDNSLSNRSFSSLDDTNQEQEDEAKSRITVSRQFKDKVVKPILKVRRNIR